MTPRRRRMVAMTGGLVCLVAATALVLTAFEQNMLYFYTPTQIAAGEAPEGRRLRVGGLVEQGSVRRTPGSLEVRFDVTDLDQTITVAYAGVLPDLFREGQGVVAHGLVGADGLFEADEVLARHDENYMPPEVAEMLEERGHPPDASLR
ncbi:MAG: cytochrome c maturation protein CcmE [Gammaproteobacteria bacterium]|nr:cytochrome c maturation protein CcmE [Gammaproteobacteria bacterium]MDE0129107.1 cytochrome c maturation protein CcmE [Gammaproteobacteria bacterium]MDE0413658.1 cytochrome c maturation protein CcmE [Gammaproteobacteria bacterium]MDE0455559.1 cytochrome c maturation protein CcmE [Gammaproteobacteria bacterium]MXZ26910.1 cytochrome c maturation protein CcmE [Gammaproteobacteria bacterium]